jgi:lipoprotein-anchoring transpeptidase ErfK/SrfK
MITLRIFRPLVFVGLLTALSGCTTMTEMFEANMPERHGGRASIVVDLSEQQAYLYRGGVLVATSRISSGREGHRTPTGRFSVIRKEEEHRSSVYGAYCDSSRQVIVADVDVRRTPKPRNTQFIGAPMPFFLEFSPGYGLHEGYLPGMPASHGCIRLPHWKARQFYNAARIGTPVVVRP